MYEFVEQYLKVNIIRINLLMNRKLFLSFLVKNNLKGKKGIKIFIDFLVINTLSFFRLITIFYQILSYYYKENAFRENF